MSTHPDTILRLAAAIMDGYRATAADVRPLLEVPPGSPAQAALLEAARAVRRRFVGDTIWTCSIVNAKAGACPENCAFCAQAASATAPVATHGWLPSQTIAAAARSAADQGAQAIALVAAWRGLDEGPLLERVCASVRDVAALGIIRVDASLGILAHQRVADRLREAGVTAYNHNLETAPGYFPAICTNHSYEDRVRTARLVTASGMRLCSGGIIGLGETLDQRIELALALRDLNPDTIPLNFLDPLPGTALAGRPRVTPDEALAVLAVFRLLLPDRTILVAGGKESTFGERLHEIFAAGINGIMVGNYLTTCGVAPDYWQTWAPRYGLTLASGKCSPPTPVRV